MAAALACSTTQHASCATCDEAAPSVSAKKNIENLPLKLDRARMLCVCCKAQLWERLAIQRQPKRKQVSSSFNLVPTAYAVASPQSSISSRIFADSLEGSADHYIVNIPRTRGTTNLSLMLDLVIN